ncbi:MULTISPECIES: O-acetylhomoserine aminocarboxypropyltransferase/cysteine synthase family protein [Rhizobium]|uniref:O-acetylhomoserine aminocarboxypropyltransferase/cysteine synthase family protein n=1 Tax=Rhizobium TaxID=379 RepID=UPI001C82B0FC|nr:MULTISPECIES: O-acetylhomoserine aminocarboxypropyltransferase/cysteine synthase family protein [Rhizobium]MBX5013988.1 O-acetylhomoserine aminocarboxypropyltransferase/cysteine synthase [Rhizobium lentis]MBY3447151.1 O-acetylhomoserine aminocarboxypropyltransferase/cysteine synthase [Rhizobium laguerreae]
MPTKTQRNIATTQPVPAPALHVETAVLHGSYRYDPTTLATTVPIYLSNAYAFESIDHASDVFDLRREGRTYSRLMNPTTDILEQRIASLEGGVAALATSSGQAAIMLAILNIAVAGDNIVSSAHLYGGTINLLSSTFQRLGIETRFVDPGDPTRFPEASDDRTRCWFAEALPNPKLTPFPIVEVGAIAHEMGILLIIDNTMTPLITRPLELGAHVTLHSTSKYICGHGTTIGGVVVDGGTFDWDACSERFPLMTRPDVSHGNIRWLEAARDLPGPYGASPFLLKMRNTLMRDFGPCPSPFASFLCIQGLETLPLRMPRHCSNARRVAEYLKEHRNVLDVTYPSLGGTLERRRAEQNMGDYGGPMIVFEIAGGIDAGRRFIERLQLVYHVANIGDARTLATHPASTTHASVPQAARLASGVRDGTIRISVGLEHVDDILADIGQALEEA